MIIGIPKERKTKEDRVAITPLGVKQLVQNSHSVIIESSAGLGSGLTDDDYINAGAVIINSVEDLFNKTDMIFKVRELDASEFYLLRKNQILVSFMHLVVNRTFTQALLEKKVTAVALETIEKSDGVLPMLRSMGEICGKKSIQIASNLLELGNGGSGIMMGSVPGVGASKVLIIGAGNVGFNAAKMASGMGADVILCDIDIEKLRNAANKLGYVKTYLSDKDIIRELIKYVDVVIGAVLIPGHKPPCIITEDMVKSMKKGSVIVDVSIDQGGIVETEDRITTLDNPFYEKFGILHYCVANIPGSVARTSSPALANESLKYVQKIADFGFIEAVKKDKALSKGVSTYNGKLTNKGAALAFDMEYVELPSLIGF